MNIRGASLGAHCIFYMPREGCRARKHASHERGCDQNKRQEQKRKAKHAAAITLPLLTVDSPGIKIDWHGNGAPYAWKNSLQIFYAPKSLFLSSIFLAKLKR